MDEFVGIVKAFGGTYAPVNWLPCDGRSLPINQYEVLYTLIGTAFGGDGVTTFNLPNLNGNVPIGAGRSTFGTVYTQGQKGGSNTFTMTNANMPPHSHTMTLNTGASVAMKANASASSTPDPTGNIPGLTSASEYATPAGMDPAAAQLGALSNTMTMSASGSPGPTPLDNRSPFMALNYIICVNGLWPSPN